MRLSKEVEGVAPCVDFAHLHARTGADNSYEEFAALLELIEGELGRDGLEDMHIHISGIDYGPGGERKHLNLADADGSTELAEVLSYVELLQVLRDFEAGGLVICESPNLEEDALLMQSVYSGLVKH